MKSIGNATWEAPYGLPVLLADGEAITLMDPSGLAETAPTFETAARAKLTGTFTGQPTNTQTVTVGLVDAAGTIVYRFMDAMTQANDVQIGADQDATLTSLGHAMAGSGTPGTDYFANTEPVASTWEVTVDTGGNTVVLEALNHGDAYDAAVAATADTASNFTWVTTTAGTNSADSLMYGDNAGTVITAADGVEAYPANRGGAAIFAPVPGQLTRKRFTQVLQDNSVNAGGDDTASSVFLRQRLTVVTTHHPAAGDPKGVLYCGVLDDPTDLDSAGAYVEIPNLSHADDGDWLGGDYSVPDVDNIVANCIMELWNPRTGVGLGWFCEVKSYDYTDAGFGTNQGRIVFAVGGGLPATIAAALRLGTAVYYRIYSSNIGRVAELATQAKADVNVEVVDALNVDTYAEPGQGTPAATLSLAAKVNYLYKAFRNRKTQTSTTWNLFNDDAVTVDQKATVADDGTTASKTEVTTGP